MSYFVIHGGTSLHGEVTISGAKNAALKLMAATLLTSEECRIHNVPDIADVRSVISILTALGARVAFSENTVTINAGGLTGAQPDYQLVKHLRASVMVIGPLLARFGTVTLPLPGGCLIGARPITTHINALRQLGVQMQHDGDIYTFTTSGLTGARVVLDEMSVTATENALLAAVCAKGDTEIHLAASEPEISDLAGFLRAMGADVSGDGTSIIKVRGVKKLHGAEYTVIPDRIEAGTFAIAAAVSRGEVHIRHIIRDHLDALMNVLQRANVRFSFEQEDAVYSTLSIHPTSIFEAVYVSTQPHPGFPTDLQAPLSVLMTQANGTSRIFETMYEGRLAYIRELQKMGASAETIDIHTAVITGPSSLTGKHITSLDIRAGATLLIAAIIAHGESRLDRVELIDRGYEHVDDRFNALGAKISRHEDDVKA